LHVTGPNGDRRYIEDARVRTIKGLMETLAHYNEKEWIGDADLGSIVSYVDKHWGLYDMVAKEKI